MNYARPPNGREVGNGPSPPVQFTFALSPGFSLMLAPAPAGDGCGASAHRPSGQEALPSQPAGLFVGFRTHLGFGPGQILSWSGWHQCWRLPSRPCTLGLCSRGCFDVYQQEPAENISPLGQW